MSTAAGTSAKAGSPVAAFRHPVFAVVWMATLVSNVGSWMFTAASGWLMTSLNPDPLIVSLVQAASSAPIFLFALPAGAFADIFDKRKYLIVIEILTTAVSALYAAIVWLDLASPVNLLLFTFLIGTVWAFLKALEPLGSERRRDGAYRWGVFEDAAEPGRIIETFLVASWMEHLRQHERVTNADRIVQECVRQFQLEGAPKVTHFIAAES